MARVLGDKCTEVSGVLGGKEEASRFKFGAGEGGGVWKGEVTRLRVQGR